MAASPFVVRSEAAVTCTVRINPWELRLGSLDP